MWLIDVVDGSGIVSSFNNLDRANKALFLPDGLLFPFQKKNCIMISNSSAVSLCCCLSTVLQPFFSLPVTVPSWKATFIVDFFSWPNASASRLCYSLSFIRRRDCGGVSYDMQICKRTCLWNIPAKISQTTWNWGPLAYQIKHVILFILLYITL